MPDSAPTPWEEVRELRARILAHDPHPVPATLAVEMLDLMAKLAGVKEPPQKKPQTS